MSPHDRRDLNAEADARAASEANNVPGAAGGSAEIPSYLDAALWESSIDLPVGENVSWPPRFSS
jgi:hypothetical protein